MENDVNTQNAIIIRQNTPDSDAEVDINIEDNSQEAYETEDGNEDDYDSAEFFNDTSIPFFGSGSSSLNLSADDYDSNYEENSNTIHRSQFTKSKTRGANGNG